MAHKTMTYGRPLPHRTPSPRRWVWQGQDSFDAVFVPGLSADTARGALAPFLPDAREVYDTGAGCLLVFGAAQDLDPSKIGYALALKRNAVGGLTSFPDAPSGGSDGLTLYLDGKLRVEPRHTWTAVDPLTLWDWPDVKVIRANTLPALPLDTSRSFAADEIPVLKNVLASDAPFAKVRERLDAKSTPRQGKRTARELGHMLARGAYVGIARILSVALVLAVVAVFVVLLAGTVATMTSGGGVSEEDLAPLAVLIAIGFVIWWSFRRASTSARPSAARTGVKAPARSAPAAAPPSPKGPGFLSYLSGWLAWRTPFGGGLSRSIDHRLNEIQKLIREDRIEEALKLSLSVSGDTQGKPGPLATRLPGMRKSLDLDFGQKGASWSLPASDGGMQDLRKTYAQLAADSESAGDFERAAFIRDELLGDYVPAVDTLARGKLYEKAAKLAMARNLQGGEIVRLWYEAGQRDVAVALATRYGCMANLILYVEPKNRNAALFLRGVWARQLAQSGDILGALRASDILTGFDAERLVWLGQEVGAGGLGTPEILHRAIAELPWREDILTGSAPGDPKTVGGALEVAILRVLDPENDAAARLALLDHFEAWLRDGRSSIAFLTTMRGGNLLDLLIRQVIADGVPLEKKRLAALRKLARKADLAVLSADLGLVRRAAPERSEPADTALKLPDPAPGQPHWTHLVCLQRARVLVGDEAGVLRIFDDSCKMEWGDRVADLAGIVRIRNGRFVLLILGHTPELRRVVMLDTVRHSYTPLGSLPLEAWHGAANEQVWLIKAAGRIQALAVPSLFEDTPSLHESWGVTLTEDVHILAFHQTESTVGWYMQRREGPESYGLIEHWTAPSRTLKIQARLLHLQTLNEDNVVLYQTPVGLRNELIQLGGAWPGQTISCRYEFYSWDAEQRFNQQYRDVLQKLDRPAVIRDFRNGPIVLENMDSPHALVRLTGSKASQRVTLEGTGWVASDAAPDTGLWALIDSAHRVVQIRPDTGEITVVA